MISADEDALICDLAETYHIYDYRALPVDYVATLALGLSANSRIKMKLSGEALTLEQSLLAIAVDKLAVIAWLMSDDARKGKNRPKSIWVELTKPTQQSRSDVLTFSSGADFEQARAKIIEKIQKKGG